MTHNPGQAEDKPQVVYFSTSVEMAELLSLTLNRYFEVTTTLGVAQVDEALNTIRKIRPAYVLVDPNAPGVAPQQLHSQIKRCDPFTVCCTGIGTLFQKQCRHFRGTVVGGSMKRCISRLIRIIDINTSFRQQMNHVRIIRTDCQREGRMTHMILDIR